MKTVENFKLTKETYDKIMELEHRNGPGRNFRAVEALMPDWLACGYGFYDYWNVRKENGEYMMSIRMGSSCD